MSRFDYYCEAVSQSFDEHGVTATAEQIKAVAADMEAARDTEGQAFYVPENPLIRENRDLQRKLKVERDKVPCPKCKGSRIEVFNFGPAGRSSTSQCDRCRGEGKVSP